MAKKRTPSSARWLAEHESDLYVQEARRLGFRSRAVFKLREIHERDRLFKPGMTVVDLGAAPGAWSQLVRPLLGSRGQLAALDILPIEPIKDVEIIQGDFRDEATLRRIEQWAPAGSVDIVLSDMAPNLSGIDTADQAASIYLAELAAEFAKGRLKPNGIFLVKMFQGEGYEDYVRQLRATFASVQVRKPRASRQRSSEVYLLARSLRVM